ncbi:hypothetical protein B0T21DRAFT_411839 [Apiosordaria backusii]|uniref:Mtf2-like C-terminal domain-containing protein n=1 Tax=Apiosordaria backusii TaxID=314023 RepID=A0AA40BLZ7_9PEZI|nr:hypothetical protein B0T21DRAFT_411839 [Apiosordaria backusii]
MSTTLLPFLYQTRTLQRISRNGVPTPALRAFMHTSTTTNLPLRKPSYVPPKRASRSSRIAPGRKGTAFGFSKGESIPFELPEDYERPPPREMNHLLTEAGDRSTITPTERDAFKSIFEEIAAKQPTPPLKDPSSLEPTRENWPGSRFSSDSPAQPSGAETIDIIIQDAADIESRSIRRLHRPYGKRHPITQAAATKDWSKALLRFPPSLRDAARRALNITEGADSPIMPPVNSDEDPDTASSRFGTDPDMLLNPLAKSVQHEALRRAERTRVEAMMQTTKTDFELWDILEKEVFPMVARFGLDKPEPPTLATDTTTKKRKGKKAAAAAAGAAAAAPSPEETTTGDEKFPLHIYGPLYPRYLLAALRLFHQRFAHPSRLALNILPRIKELGPASYVLGVSTPFYNELLRILWYRYGDAEGVLNMLEEMRKAGILYDADSLKVLNAISSWVRMSEIGKEGPFLKELVSLPEWEYGMRSRLRHWGAAMQEQRRELDAAV